MRSFNWLFGKVVGMFFGKQKEEGRKLEEAPSIVPRVPEKVKVVRVRPTYVPRERNVSSHDTISKRRRKKMQAHAANTPTPPLQDKPVIATYEDLYVLLPIDVFLPKTYNAQQVRCIKEILCCMWRSAAIQGGYVQFLSIKHSVVPKAGDACFDECFEWMEKSKLIIRNPNHGPELLVSLDTGSKHTAETQKFVNVIKKAFHDMEAVVPRS